MIKLKSLLLEAAEAVMNVAEAQKLASRLEKEINAPYVSTRVSTLGGQQRPSVLVTLSLDPKEHWPNKILHNSRYMMFSVNYDGSIDQFSRQYTFKTKFRKARFTKSDEVAGKINAYLEKVQG